MDHRYLGASGLLVSELCLGTMTFGKEADEQTSHQLLDRYVEAGGDFVDTADVYGGGASEEIIGRWLAKRNRDDLVIATKGFWATGGRPNDHGAGRKHLLAAVKASLRRLGTDYIDLYQLHCFDESTPIEETLSTLDGLVRAGLVRHLGVSNYAAWQLQKSIDVARFRGWEPFVAAQPLYNLIDRDVELELVPVCRNEGAGILPWSPLRGGWLTGKYRRGMTQAPPDTRWEGDQQPWLGDWENSVDDRTWSITDALLAVAEEIGRSPAQVALRWLSQRPGVTAPIIGARSVRQLDDNLGAAGWVLDEKSVARLTAAGDKPLPYPHGYLARSPRSR
ncbi:putative aldo/keto reductase [Actinoplanes missouriensis 431]|uniref:Putative aldo/keto reductase n=1 Tax=Actinoplanes missouriensis (strain ATCC 14538 / DSM 43046 / CBS 188.64 / JCM 3121 / NBRC 102363 / NCIMB 12654 / NRRL B-3342 / UNCC 431) TaxID=512565 RepID=I0HAD3_ACTM4|nr:aldo/keto reductase [Actinoplanes missouriensis]BAL89970.1 putative aldo/keto reductase [Actinoplanes missouriensis 431]